MIGSGLLAGAAAALLLWNTVLPPAQQQQNGVSTSNESNTHQPSSISQTQPIPVPSPSSEAPAAASQPSMNDGIQSDAPRTDEKRAQSLMASRRSAGRDDAGPIAATMQQSVPTALDTRTKTVHTPSSIKGLKAVELTSEELKALGVSVQPDGIQLTATLGYDVQDPVSLQAFRSNSGSKQTQVNFNQGQLANVIKSLGYDNVGAMQFSIRLDSFDLRSTLQPKSTEPEIAPVMISQQITDAQGNKNNRILIFGNSDRNASQNSSIQNEMSELYDLYSIKTSTTNAPTTSTKDLSNFPVLSKLIPVRVTLMDDHGVGSDIILWYYPNSTFINALPRSMGERIQDELDRAHAAEANNTAQNAPPVVQARERGEYQYMDVARAASGGVEILSLGPNPAREQSTIHYRLNSDRTVKVVLYDMSGRLLSTLVDQLNPGVGEHEQVLDCHNLSSGAYLLCIVSNTGEQAVQRFIIQN